MKKQSSLLSLITFTFTLLMIPDAEAQILNKIKKSVAETAENKAINKSAEATEKAIDEAAEGMKNKKKDGRDEESADAGNEQNDKYTTGAVHAKPDTGSLMSYSNYDFVPGDKIIYFYDMAGEADSEIPGRMLLNSGNAEIQTFNGEKVLLAPAGGTPYMMPYMKEDAYLPEQFTLEFDLLSNGGIGTSTDVSEIRIYFRGSDRAGSGDATAPVLIRLEAVSGENPHYGFEAYKESGAAAGTHHGSFPSAAVNTTQNNWRHIAIYINKNIGKLYIDQHRLAVINQVRPGSVNMVEIEVNNSENQVLFKNFCVAAGGTDSYNKVMTEGKFIAYGILFDVNKATLRPESMGTINEFVKMMKEKTELKFEIGGHTDSDGTAARNNALSQERADAVKRQMMRMGIDEGRLTAKGYGSSKPLVDNNAAENKAKNRRVEFVKQ